MNEKRENSIFSIAFKNKARGVWWIRVKTFQFNVCLETFLLKCIKEKVALLPGLKDGFRRENKGLITVRRGLVAQQLKNCPNL